MTKTKRYLKLVIFDLRRAFGSIGFKIAIVISLGLSLYHAYYNIQAFGSVYQDHTEYPTSLFQLWLGGERFSFVSSLLFHLLPLLTALPYGSSYYDDKKSGYLKHLYLVRKKTEVLTSRCIANFCSGFFIVVFPYIVSLLTLGLIYPALKPEITTQNFLANNAFLINIYLEHPLLYCLLYLLIMGVFFGLLSCLSLTVSHYLKYRTIVIIFPFIFWIATIFILSLFKGRFTLLEVMMHPTQYAYPTFNILLTYILCAFLVSIPLFIYKGIKSETY